MADRRNTPKQRVLKKHPNARRGYEVGPRPRNKITRCIHIGETRLLGTGKTWAAAWADAARKL